MLCRLKCFEEHYSGQSHLAAAYGKAGRADEGLKCLGEAATRVEATEERWAEAHMHRVRGELLVAIGERAATSLARFWCERDKRREARDLDLRLVHRRLRHPVSEGSERAALLAALIVRSAATTSTRPTCSPATRRKPGHMMGKYSWSAFPHQSVPER
jgi:hypothetical protein